MPYFQVDHDDVWTGSTGSVINQHRRCAPNTCPAEDGAFERLSNYPGPYDYGVFIGYNADLPYGTGAVPGMGSAFFLHVKNASATGGCVAVSRTQMVWILRWLRPSANPIISIGVGSAAYSRHPEALGLNKAHARSGSQTGLLGGDPEGGSGVNPTPSGSPSPQNAAVTTVSPAHAARWPADLLAGVGIVSLVAVVALVVRTGNLGALLAALLAAAFLAAGTLGSRARPDHAGTRLLLAVGTTHLFAFALTGWVGSSGSASGWGPWLIALVGDAAYLAGFVLLAILVAAYPSGRLITRGMRVFAAAGASFAAIALIAEAAFHSRLGLALDTTVASVPAPPPLPLRTDGPSLVGLVPGLVVVGVVLLLVRARSLSAADRPALGWAQLAGCVLALMLLASPAASRVLPQHVWDAAFIVVVSGVPFALLAGLVRYRLLEVDLYVVRTLGRGVVVLLVLVAYAAASALLEGQAAASAAVVLTVLAALTGIPLMRRVQRLADRWLTGGRVGQRAVVDEMVAAIAVPDRERLAERLCSTVAHGLDVSWVRLVVGSTVTATVGDPPDGREPEVIVALRTADAEVGTLECGPRRGGWRRAERAEVEAVGTPAALALRDAQLTAELQARVAELTESRTRLVQAEQTVRRQVERDLHDGAQQQLVALLARLGIARAVVEGGAAADSVAAAQELAQQCLRDLRALVAGLHPTVLGERGLTAAVEARAGLMPIPVAVDADPRIAGTRFPADIESAAFFVASEALANVLKHSGADRARVVLVPFADGGLRVAVTDEGSGMADPAGSGLSGLRTRVEALGGRFSVQATAGVGTTIVAEFGAESPVMADV